MNAQFTRSFPDEPDTDDNTLHQMRFNGDRQAFLRANVFDFYALLSQTVIWLNDTLLATRLFTNDQYFHSSTIVPNIQPSPVWMVSMQFETNKFALYYFKTPNEADVPILDMLLEGLRQQQVCDMQIGSPPAWQILRRMDRPLFSSGALHQCLVGNTRLRALSIQGLWINDDASDVIGQVTGLDSLELERCEVDLQRLVNTLARNVFGPETIKLTWWPPQPERNVIKYEHAVDFFAFMKSLLQNPRLKVLYIRRVQMFVRSDNLKDLKATFASSTCLKDLRIFGNFQYDQTDELQLLFQGIAAAPNLRTLGLRIVSDWSILSSPEPCQILADAFKDSQNDSLERIVGSEYDNGEQIECEEEICDRDLNTIVEFNRERCCFVRRASGNCGKRNEQLVRALVAADASSNHHFCYWLVRNYVADLCGARRKSGLARASWIQ
jgi:hypothetical protein